MNQFFTHAIVASVLSITSITPASIAAEPISAEQIAKEIDRHVAPAIAGELFPGAVIGLYSNGETHFYPVGTINYDDDQPPTIDTLFEIGSVSKVITGVLFADAVRRGEVTNDTLVDSLLPDGYKVLTKAGEDLKLWHLTSHTSGWRTAPVNLAPADGERPFTGYTQTMMFEAINMMPLNRPPGTKMEYSNFAAGLLGTLVSLNAESQNEGDYEALSKERILAPLGIKDFTIALDKDQQQRLAPPTASGRSTKAWGKTGPMDPAGMWVTNAPGLLKFAMANLKGDDAIDDDIHASLALAREPMFDLGGNQRICSGWFIAGDGETYWHNGMTGGYSSYMAVNREMDLAIVVLANGAAMQTGAIGEKIIQFIAGMNPEPIKVETGEKLDDAYAAKLVGEYTLAPAVIMHITVSRGRLFAQLTGQQALGLANLGDDRFKIAMVEAELQFDVPKDGNATSVTLFQSGREMKCERKE